MFLNSLQNLSYDTPAAKNTGIFTSAMFLKVANETLTCSTTITYYPDPEFENFTSTRTGDGVRITIQVMHIFFTTCTNIGHKYIKGQHLFLLSFQKKADRLEMTPADLIVWGVQEGKRYPCIMEEKESSNETDFFYCEVQKRADTRFQHLVVNLSVIRHQAGQ